MAAHLPEDDKIGAISHALLESCKVDLQYYSQSQYTWEREKA